MDTVAPKKIQKLLEQVELLEKVLQSAGEEGLNRLKSTKVDEVRREIPKTTDGKFDPKAWSELDRRKQIELHRKLALLVDSQYATVGLDGPADPKHIMHAEYASNAAILVWAVAGFLLAAAMLCSIIWYWDKATGTDLPVKVEVAITAIDDLAKAKEVVAKTMEELAAVPISSTDEDDVAKRNKLKLELDAHRMRVGEVAHDVNSTAVEAVKAIKNGGATERSVLLMVMLLGGLGGSLHFLRSLVTFVGTRRLKRSWLLYYLSMPLTGAGLAPIVYMLLRVGLINPSGTSANGSAVTNVNLIAIYAFSILSGLFARTALDKLHEVFKTLFRTQGPEPGDKAGSEKPPGGEATSTGDST